MWSPPVLNVEPCVEPLRSRRSGVVAHRPPGPLVHLSKISGPVRPFFSFSCLFSGVSSACWRAVRISGCVGRVGWLVWVFSGALKPTVRVYCRRLRCGGGLVGRCPWGEAVGADVAAGRLMTLGSGRSGGFVGSGSFDPDGLNESCRIKPTGKHYCGMCGFEKPDSGSV